MKLSEIKGEAALDVLAEIIEPAVEIMADPIIKQLAADDAPKIKFLKPIIKGHKKEIIQIMAALDGMDPGEYEKHINLFSLPAKVLEILNDPELVSLFTSQSLSMEEITSGSASVNTEGNNQ